MNTFSLLAATIASMVIAFLVCGIPFGYLIARIQGNVDVRTVGSGNIGTTNVARSVGKSAAIATLVCDAGKGALSCLLGTWIVGTFGTGGNFAIIQPAGAWGWTISLVYLAAVAGHVFSPYLHFHGGKGIAVGFGGALGFCWPLAIGMLVVFLIFELPSHYVSLGSVMAAISLPILGIVIYHPNPLFVVPLVCITVIVLWAHRSNIDKLRKGKENKLSFHHDEKKA